MGRLFDAVAALAGLSPRARYEGEGALALEGAFEPGGAGRYPFPIDAVPVAAAGEGDESPEGERLVLDPRPLIRAVSAELAGGVSVGRVSARFHRTLADATVRAVLRIAARTGVWTVALSGGVFQNVRLLERTAGRLAHAGVRVLVPSKLPPNDGGIAYGQAAIAAAGGGIRRGGAQRVEGGAPPPAGL
jgi:hydrogenase maturation protein HypF